MELSALCRQAAMCENILTFLDFPSSSRLVVANQTCLESCRRNGHVVAGSLVSNKHCFAEMLPLVHIPSVMALRAHGPNPEFSALVLALLSKEWKSLQHIAIVNDQTPRSSWHGLCRAMRARTSIHSVRTLKLSKCAFFPGVLDDLAGFLSKDGAITDLTLEKCRHIGSNQTAAASIFDALSQHRSAKVVSIFCDRGLVGEWCGESVANMLSQNTSLKRFQLCNASLGSLPPVTSGDLDAPAFNSSLRSLDLSHNSFGHGWDELIKKILLRTTALEVLRLNNANFGASTCIIFNALAKNSTLRDLDLSHNSIGYHNRQSWFQSIGNMLSHNNTLKTLSLSDNRLFTAGAKVVVEALRSNNSLTRLSLAGNHIDERDPHHPHMDFRSTVPDALACTLEFNTTLEYIDLERHGSRSLAWDKLCMMLAKRTQPLDIRL